ncbi:uncharacterized protein LOC129765001 [Toxorhynchites rutilus septentrionalis]|uniref:uncharacterized protein LOC129765001 n=1 Tax=Toxorhynchites rutilus septentrionalis TaxID=329112 RepID=UPI00247A29C7|nr:uncharacterized protein LOC129765001 [Toxorhynchites rutilus septentrionalis]
MRTYKRKTNRGSTSAEELREAAAEVKGGKSISLAAREYDIKRTTLSRYCERMKFLSVGENPTNEVLEVGYKTPRKVFSEFQEKELTHYMLHMAAICFGCSPKEVGCLAYQCTEKFRIPDSAAWERNKMAGKDWLTNFLRRNSTLSIRKPEATSLTRATSFNMTNATEYFEKLSAVVEKYMERRPNWDQIIRSVKELVGP